MKIFLIFLLTLISVTSLGWNYYLYSQVELQKQLNSQALQKITSTSVVCIRNQRSQKNEIADLWVKQADINDSLADAQGALITSMEDYVRLVEKSIRFVQGTPQLQSGTNEADFFKTKNSLVKTISDLKNVFLEKAELKKKSENRINQIYVDAGENRNNTLSEKDGDKEACLN